MLKLFCYWGFPTCTHNHFTVAYRCSVVGSVYAIVLVYLVTWGILLISSIIWFNEASLSCSHSRWSQRLLGVAGSRKQRPGVWWINRRYCYSVFRRFTHAPSHRESLTERQSSWAIQVCASTHRSESLFHDIENPKLFILNNHYCNSIQQHLFCGLTIISYGPSTQGR